MVYNAVAQSAQPIISFNHGAQLTTRVRKTLSFSLVVSILIGVAISAVFFFFAPAVVSIFLDNGTATGLIASEGLPYYATGFVFMAINICVVGYYQSIERAGLAVLLTLLRGVVFLVAAFVVLPSWIGTKGLWLAIPTAEALTTIVIVSILLAKKS